MAETENEDACDAVLEANLPALFDKWNPAMRGAYMKGRRAYLAGKSVADVPYRDRWKPSGGLSWSRAFIRAWQDGFTDMQRMFGRRVPITSLACVSLLARV